jgi:hypothetical protein
VYATDPPFPPGEYDDVVDRLLRLLVDGAPVERLADLLRRYVTDELGLPSPGDELAVASRIVAHWDAAGPCEVGPRSAPNRSRGGG